MHTVRQCGLIVSAGLMLAGTLIFVGCESSSMNAGALIVEPSSVTITNAGSTHMFSVAMPQGTNAAVYMPLIWSVSRPDLGTISQVAGAQAVYVSTGIEGGNVIMVSDQGESEGMAVVNQVYH